MPVLNRVARRFGSVAVLATVVLSLSMTPAWALITRSGNPLVVAQSETINDTFFGSGDSVVLGGRYNGDVFASGGTVDFTGSTRRNLFVAGGRVTIEGTVDGDVFVTAGTVEIDSSAQLKGNVYAAGGQVRIDAPIGGELFAAGGQLDMTANSSTGRSAAIAGGSMGVAGAVGRDLLASGGTLTLSSQVTGNVRAEVDTLQIAPTAKIGGDLTYVSRREATVPEGVVTGRVTRIVPQDARNAVNPVTALLGGLFAWLQSIVGMLLFGLALVLLAPGTMTMAERRVQADPWRSLGVGVLTMLVVPAVAGIVLVAGVFLGGWWIALFALVLLVIATVVGYVVTAMCIARWLLERFSQHRNHPLLTMTLGVVLLGFVSVIPFLGWLVALGAGAAGLGSLVMIGFKRRTLLPEADAMAEASVPPSGPGAPAAGATAVDGQPLSGPVTAATPAQPEQTEPAATADAAAAPQPDQPSGRPPAST